MNAKEYLKQAFYLDKSIKCKLEQVDSLNELATKARVTISDMPKNPNKGISILENTVVKIVDLQEEINKDIESLVDLKKEITATIKKIDNRELEIILEKRYLCFEPWEKIAKDMKFSSQHTFRLHGKALKLIEEKRGE